ncbi:MAG: NAD(+) synthase, partial [Lachnoclostridium sp.]|nr:NAD(+) synthase [Lachnoclostridium sp.]
ERFHNQAAQTEIDIEKIISERRHISTDLSLSSEKGYTAVYFQLNDLTKVNLTRNFDKMPFVPDDVTERKNRCEEVLAIQTAGLKKRFRHTGSQKAILGLSGGMDSTLALIVTVQAFDLLEITRRNIICITMPCFGTTDRTYQNAVLLAKEFNVTLKEIPIQQSVTLHLEEIGHDMNKKDSTYENSQARERTQILMDIANQENGLVIGTGDMSELALGWATYNGDHMSMYGVNSSVPKTLVRFLIRHYADVYCDSEKKAVLYDVLETPISPELLPSNESKNLQKTEEIIGPYELHDFFLYHTVRFGFSSAKILRMAAVAFAGDYDEKIIKKWLDVFYRRFYSQQFKRSCMPDGPSIGSVSLSPRTGFMIPSDADHNVSRL